MDFTDLRFIGKYENIVFLDSNVVSKNRISTY
ncbi:ATP-binding protein, partial [Staphylococcus aureus]